MSDTIKPILSYYGDDFTGSTDVMEAMASNGFPSVLFLGIPDTQLRSRFSECQVIGIAGTSRSESPEWMDNTLPDIFQWLKNLNADFCHYKVCSTFDSSPTIGNIGRAIEVGKKVFEQTCVPLIVGAPQLKRYTAFGHLFAAYQGLNYRIDRHPVMSRHPVTPMCEADLRIHLSEQTNLDSQLIDLVQLHGSAQQVIDSIISEASGIVMFDVDSDETQRLAGEQIHRLGERLNFVAGSSGLEYALLSHWKNSGELQNTVAMDPVDAVDQIAVVSGSVSPTTERQIKHAAQNGFQCIPVDPLNLIGEQAPSTIDAIVKQSNDVLTQGLSPLVHTAMGPGEDKGHELDSHPEARHRIGRALGVILRRIVDRHNLQRVVIAGGDTSSHALQELHVEALTLLMPIPSTPGSPLCVCHGAVPATDGLQIALKGGQVGDDNYFSIIRNPASNKV
jgi:uncharacterized protein YgbK (DUF1537 family)